MTKAKYKKISLPDDGDTKIDLLVEIVSADLPKKRTLDKPDVYCVVHLGEKEVHRTSAINNDWRPIWTIETKSMFVLQTTPHELGSKGLTFDLHDDNVGRDKTYGTFPNSMGEDTAREMKKILKASGKRIEKTLTPVKEKKDDDSEPIKLVLRFRIASEHDVKFMKHTDLTGKTDATVGAFSKYALVPPDANKDLRIPFISRNSKVGPNGETLHRVKPHPDPARKEETEYLSLQEMKVESLQPSQHWIEAGSGKLGKLYLEVIRCDNLPSMNTFSSKEKGTDAFCCIVYEDSVVNTAVINDLRSPRWMPWTQRAFVFHMMHPSSQIHIGVIDYDYGGLPGLSRENPIARISVDINNLRPNTEYLLDYDLWTSSMVSNNRRKVGIITVRMRFEWENNCNRDPLLASLPGSTSDSYLGLVSKDDFRATYFTIVGETNIERFSLKVIASYVDELKTYLGSLDYIVHALGNIILWRAPLHSLIAFVGGITLAENLDLAPAYLLFSIAWLFIVTGNVHKRQHPHSPWHSTASFMELLKVLFFGTHKSETVPPDANIDLISKNKVQREEERRQNAAEEEERLKKEQDIEAEVNAMFGFLGDVEEDEDGVVATSTTRKVSLNPLRPILFPLQRVLGKGLVRLRTAKRVILWDESYQAFWITFICLALGMSLLFVPWGFILRWVMRILVWVLLGPWMKLVDIFVVKRKKNKPEEKKTQKKEEQLLKELEENLADITYVQIQNEDAVKQRAMKKFMFGEFVVRVPGSKENRFPDHPLPSSSAKPFDATDVIVASTRKIGQRVEGDMVPTGQLNLGSIE